MMDYTDSDELYAQPMPRSWVLPLLMPLLAFGLYFWTLAPVPFPGAPARALSSQLLLNDSIPFLFPVWGLILRLLPGKDPAFAASLLSAIFGALSILIFTALIQRVRFSVHDKDDPVEIRAEYRARRLAAAVSALYLAVCYPFWVHCTRSLPGSFHVFLLLAVVWIFSEYQRRGDTFLLLLFGLFYGIGCVEYTTFVIFAPLAAILVFRAMYQRAAFRWAPFVGTFLCALPAALIYLAQSRFLWDTFSAKAEAFGYDSATDILLAILRSQWHLITGPAMAVGFLIVLTLVVIPWSILFIVRTQRPAWRYTFWQNFLRAAIYAAGGLVLAEIAISPSKIFGNHDPMLMPHLILAVCVGRVCGEFSIMGAFPTRKPHGALVRRFGHGHLACFNLDGHGLPVDNKADPAVVQRRDARLECQQCANDLRKRVYPEMLGVRQVRLLLVFRKAGVNRGIRRRGDQPDCRRRVGDVLLDEHVEVLYIGEAQLGNLLGALRSGVYRVADKSAVKSDLLQV